MTFGNPLCGASNRHLSYGGKPISPESTMATLEPHSCRVV